MVLQQIIAYNYIHNWKKTLIINVHLYKEVCGIKEQISEFCFVFATLREFSPENLVQLLENIKELQNLLCKIEVYETANQLTTEVYNDFAYKADRNAQILWSKIYHRKSEIYKACSIFSRTVNKWTIIPSDLLKELQNLI